jgi:hypothetical protein
MNQDISPPTEEKHPPAAVNGPDRSSPRQEMEPIEGEIITIQERRAETPLSTLPPPLHILSALATIALDWIWFAVELPATISLAFLPSLIPLTLGLGLLNFVAVSLVQHYLADEAWGKALAKGLVMGIVAGVPYPVFGTAVGVPLATWAGIREVQKLLTPKT